MKNSLEIKHIVLADDGSEEADHAFEYARAFAQQLGAELDVLSVIPRPAIGDEAMTAALAAKEPRYRPVMLREPS
jgi:nucleotide-binding universal stress UspA family protein